MKGLKNFLILSVFLTVAAVGFGILSQGATGSVDTIFSLNKQMVKVAAVVLPAIGLYFVAKELT